TTPDVAKLSAFRNIIKEKSQMHKQAPGLQHAKNARVESKLLVQRDFMVPTFEHDAIKQTVGQGGVVCIVFHGENIPPDYLCPGLGKLRLRQFALDTRELEHRDVRRKEATPFTVVIEGLG